METRDAREERDAEPEREGLGWTLLGMHAMASVWDNPEDCVYDAGSSGIVVRLSSWRPGMNKVALTKLLHEGGSTLTEAIRLTDAILDGHMIVVTLRQFASVEAAAYLLTAIGIDRVEQVTP